MKRPAFALAVFLSLAWMSTAQVPGPLKASPDGRYFVDPMANALGQKPWLHLDKVEAKNARATWISPVTGERKDAGNFATGNLTGSTFPNGQTQFFKTPGHWEDAVLLLEGFD